MQHRLALFYGGNRTLRVFGTVADSDKQFESVIADQPLRQAMLIYARNIAILVADHLADTADARLLRHQPHHDPRSAA